MIPAEHGSVSCEKEGASDTAIIAALFSAAFIIYVILLASLFVHA